MQRVSVRATQDQCDTDIAASGAGCEAASECCLECMSDASTAFGELPEMCTVGAAGTKKCVEPETQE